jgi:micrococcal nuclease
MKKKRNKKKSGQIAWNSKLEIAQGRNPYTNKKANLLAQLKTIVSKYIFIVIFFSLIIFLAVKDTHILSDSPRSSLSYTESQKPFLVSSDDIVITGKVVGISDGDTLTILDSNSRQIKIRLAEIDTPEKGQPYGNRAKEELSKLVFNKTVTIIQVDIDRYKRVIGKVYVDNLYINKELVSLGAAWVYLDYSKDPDLLSVQDEAKRHLRGLWSLPEDDIIPPWEWRRR